MQTIHQVSAWMRLIFTRIYPFLIPSCHWQVIIYSVGEQNLMQVNDPVHKCSCAGTEIQLPHTHKTLTEHISYFILMFLEISSHSL